MKTPQEIENEQLRAQIQAMQHQQALEIEQQRNAILGASVQQQKRGNMLTGILCGLFAIGVVDDLFDGE